jgi:hypothetical protein
MNRLSSVLAGYYVLFLEQPTVGPGVHAVEVRLTRRQGTVLTRKLSSGIYNLESEIWVFRFKCLDSRF